MEKKKALRIAGELCTIFSPRFRLLKSVVDAFFARTSVRQPVPSIVDICLFPEVRAIVDIDPSMNLIEDDLKKELNPILASLVARWRADVDSQLLEFAESNLGISRCTNLSLLASAIFKCSRCRVGCPYPDILSHRCLQTTPESYQYNGNNRDPLRWLTYEGRVQAMYNNSCPWSCNVLESSPWRERTKGVIRTCGLDPRTATCHDMDALDMKTRLVCRLCRHSASRTAMTWRTAVKIHHLRKSLLAKIC
jgi:hypothetical protein